jgi:hypothetical protein
VLLGRLLGTEVEAENYPFDRGGWDKAIKSAAGVARMAYHRGLDGALFAIDNDGDPPHSSSAHDQQQCRLCRLRESAKVEDVVKWDRSGLAPLRFFFAVPVRILETWLLHHRGGHTLGGNIEEMGVDPNGRRKLKKALYGHELPTAGQMVDIAVPLARAIDPERLSQQSASFRHFAEQVRPPLPPGPSSG